MSDVGADELNREQVTANIEAGEAVPEPAALPVEPTPAAPDHEAAVGHLMNAVERIQAILAFAQASLPALSGLLGHMNALAGHVTAARQALNPPVDIPPKAE